MFDKTSQFFRENSHQQTWLTGDVVGYYTIALNSTICNTSQIASLAKQAATTAGVDVSAYRRYVYVFPRNSCGWLGSATLGGFEAWINEGLSQMVISHEMGHNFGLYHSHALYCSGALIGNACSVIEYGDSLDTMASVNGHFNAAQKERLGWLPDMTDTVQTDGTYVLDPYEAPVGANPKALKILKSPGTWYYVEYRQPIGFDGFLSAPSLKNVRNGIVIHTRTGSHSHLLDMTPETASLTDPALEVGHSFSDPAAGMTITPLWANTTGVAVAVTLASTGSLPNAPPIAVAGSDQTVAVTTSVTLNGSLSYDPDGNSLTYTWNFGGGATATGALVTHAYPTAGTYAVTLTVSDGQLSASDSAVITVNATGGTGDLIDAFDRPDSSMLGNGWGEVAGDLTIGQRELKTAALKGTHLAIVAGLRGAIQNVAADFASVDNSPAPRFGVALRFQDPQNYYLVYRQAGGSSALRISRIVNGTEKILATTTLANPGKNVFFRLSGSVNGTTLTLDLNGVKRLAVSDSTFSDGSLGLLLGSGAAVAYRADNFAARVQ